MLCCRRSADRNLHGPPERKHAGHDAQANGFSNREERHLFRDGRARISRARQAVVLRKERRVGARVRSQQLDDAERGNESYWAWLSQEGYAIADMLVLLDSEKRSARSDEIGLINQPDMTAASLPPYAGDHSDRNRKAQENGAWRFGGG